MNLKNIQSIVNSDLPNWEQLLIVELSTDKNIIPILLSILNSEREDNKKLIEDLNSLLSKAHVGLEEPKLNKDGFMQKEIDAFYKSGRIGHCFKTL